MSISALNVENRERDFEKNSNKDNDGKWKNDRSKPRFEK